MTILLTLTVLALIAIALWQITKIFELSQPKKTEHSGSRRR
jgi:cytochrome c oxidase subunit 2